jgi:glycosyltransferase involved in cell wall biosynthesis
VTRVRPINVLDLRDSYEIGGPGKTILETYRAVDPSKYRLHLGVFLTREESDDTPFIRAARELGMPVHLIRGFNQYDPRLISRVAHLVKTLDIDILHSHEVKSDVITYLAVKLRPVTTVTTLHGWIGNSPKQRLLVAINKRVVRSFDLVVAVSGTIHNQLAAAGVPKERVRLLHNGIVLARYRKTGNTGFLENAVGRRPVGPVIAAIGRLSREKGHADLVEALAMVVGSGQALTAIVAGDGPERQRLAERIHAHGLDDSVHLIGHVARPEYILEETDLAVLPSHTEGLPNAALEALAMEVPVLATRVGGTPEVITDGETGRLVEAHAPAALADAIGDFLRDPLPWRQMACRGKRMVEQNFDFGARTLQLEAMYRDLIESRER